MLYRTLGSSGLKVSAICLGTMMFGGPTSEADSIRIMHKAFDGGINFLDTANSYSTGGSEVVVGKALSGRREKVVLATKGRQRPVAGVLAMAARNVAIARNPATGLRRPLGASSPRVPKAQSAGRAVATRRVPAAMRAR